MIWLCHNENTSYNRCSTRTCNCKTGAQHFFELIGANLISCSFLNFKQVSLHGAVIENFMGRCASIFWCELAVVEWTKSLDYSPSEYQCLGWWFSNLVMNWIVQFVFLKDFFFHPVNLNRRKPSGELETTHCNWCGGGKITLLLFFL